MIILTSSVASVANHIYENYLSDKNYTSVLFVDTAAEPEVGKEEGDDEWLQADLQSLRDQGYQVDRYSITGNTTDEIEKRFDAYDILYMCGGNTMYLLQQLQNTGAFDLVVEKVRNGKPYIGTSAGSIVAGPKIPVYFESTEGIELDDYTGFGFINSIPVPHWGSEHFREEYLDEIGLAYQDTEPPLFLLSDYHYLVIEDGDCITVVDTNTS